MRFILLLIMLTTTAFANRVITLSSDNTISFNQPFSAVFVAKKQQEFINLVKDDPTKEINIVLYTPGGSITAGQRFFDTIKAYPNKVNTITIFAASMGYMTVQNLGKRYILPSGILMSHRAKLGGVGGEIPGEFNVIVNFFTALIGDLTATAASRVGLSVSDYETLIRDEFWTFGKSAVKNNHADEVIYAKCDNTLQGTKVDTVRTFFGPVQVLFSKCPLVTAPIDIRSSNERVRNTVNKMFNLTLKSVRQSI